MKFILINLFLGIMISCAKTPPSTETNIYPWTILDQFPSEEWKSATLQDKLGRPNKIYPAQNSTPELWVYDDPNTHLQSWSFELSQEGKVMSLAYFPQSYNKDFFSLDEIKKNWAQYGCQEKSEQKLRPDLIKVVTFLECAKKRKAFFNKWREVSSISIVHE